jgi:hypothetical protein
MTIVHSDSCMRLIFRSVEQELRVNIISSLPFFTTLASPSSVDLFRHGVERETFLCDILLLQEEQRHFD